MDFDLLIFKFKFNFKFKFKFKFNCMRFAYCAAAQTASRMFLSEHP